MNLPATNKSKILLAARIAFFAFPLCFYKAHAIYTNKTMLIPRPHEFFLPHEHTLFHRLHNNLSEEMHKVGLQATPFFSHSQNASSLEQYFMFLGKNSLSIGRDSDIDNRYLKFDELSPEHLTGSIRLFPKTLSYGMRLDLLKQLTRYIKHATLHISSYIVHTSINPGLHVENEIISSEDNKSIADYFRGEPMVQETDGDEIRNLQEPLKKGKIDGRQKKTGLADIHVRFSYNVIRKKHARTWINALLLIPTTRGSQATYLFEPRIGTGGHFALGVGINGRYRLLSVGSSGRHELLLVYDARYYYLFKSHEVRILGLKKQDGTTLNWGHYLLLGLKENPLIIPAANVLAQNVLVHPQSHVEALLQLSYVNRGFTLGIGYNFWIKQSEHIEPNDIWQEDTYGFPSSDYATKIRIPLSNDRFNFTKFDSEHSNVTNTIQKMNKDASVKKQGFITAGQLDTNAPQSPGTFISTFFFSAGYVWQHGSDAYFAGSGFSYQFPFNNAGLQQFDAWIKGGIIF